MVLQSSSALLFSRSLQTLSCLYDIESISGPSIFSFYFSDMFSMSILNPSSWKIKPSPGTPSRIMSISQAPRHRSQPNDRKTNIFFPFQGVMDALPPTPQINLIFFCLLAMGYLHTALPHLNTGSTGIIFSIPVESNASQRLLYMTLLENETCEDLFIQNPRVFT